MNSLLAQRVASQLVIVDTQTRLCAVMDQQALTAMVKCSSILLQVAKLLAIPIIYTEQYPQGLGRTLPELAQYLVDSAIEKTSFSCTNEKNFTVQLNYQRPQIILAGIEAHVCILQTALRLQEMGYQPFVVEDAVISRDVKNKVNAIDRLRQAGVIITNTESVVLEWQELAEGDHFKQISRLIR